MCLPLGFSVYLFLAQLAPAIPVFGLVKALFFLSLFFRHATTAVAVSICNNVRCIYKVPGTRFRCIPTRHKQESPVKTVIRCLVHAAWSIIVYTYYPYLFWCHSPRSAAAMLHLTTTPSFSILNSRFFTQDRLGVNKPGHHPAGAAVAGAAATVFHDAIMTPMDVVKQRLQLGYHKGMLDCVMTIRRTEGSQVCVVSGFSFFVRFALLCFALLACTRVLSLLALCVCAAWFHCALVCSLSLLACMREKGPSSMPNNSPLGPRSPCQAFYRSWPTTLFITSRYPGVPHSGHTGMRVQPSPAYGICANDPHPHPPLPLHPLPPLHPPHTPLQLPDAPPPSSRPPDLDYLARRFTVASRQPCS